MAHKHIGLTKAQMLEQFPRIQKQLDRADLMLHDVMNGLVTYGEWIKEENGKYRVGISRENSYPLCIVTFRCTGQNDSISVYDLERFEADMRNARHGSECYEPIVLAIQSAKDAAERKRLESANRAYSPDSSVRAAA